MSTFLTCFVECIFLQKAQNDCNTNYNFYFIPATSLRSLLISKVPRSIFVGTSQHRINVVCRMLPRLFNKDLIQMNWPYMDFVHCQQLELWNILLLKCPNLKIINLQVSSTSRILRRQYVYSLALKTLPRLQIAFLSGFIECTDDHLCAFAENMPNLR